MNKELEVIRKARGFVKESGVNSVPVNLELYVAAANARIKTSNELGNDESGQTFPLNGKNIITVNANHSEERQRFTVLHEIGHIVLGIPSKHQDGHIPTTKLMSHKKRQPEEVLCDVFAAECLLPHDFFKKDIDDSDICLDSIKQLADRYKASLTCTGSQFAAKCDYLCTFVLIEKNMVRHASRSELLCELNGWVDIGSPTPPDSVASFLIKNRCDATQYDEVPVETWFSNGVGNYRTVCEEAIFTKEWNQCLSLLWFDESLQPGGSIQDCGTGNEEPPLEELGEISW